MKSWRCFVTEAVSALVDTNVLLDIYTNDPDWAPWSVGQLEAAVLRGAVGINDIIYAEISVRFSDVATLDEAVERSQLQLLKIPRAALFLAGKAFHRYRSVGGPRARILPDFLIGAHAALLGVPLLTRDTRRYRSHFPTLQLLTP
jgi:hypothetical protein